jgi:signal peptidase
MKDGMLMQALGILQSLKVKYFYREDGSIIFLTKGDNNSVDDRGLYAQGQLWLEKKDVVGRARG